MVSNGWENPIIKLRRQGQNPRILPRGTTSSIDQVVKWAEIRSRCMRNDENAGDHCHLNAWTLHSLAHRCYAAFYRHHHRWWITLFRPEICHCIQWSPHQMGEPHRHRTHDYPSGLSGGWEPLCIRLRNRPAERQLYTSRIGSRSLPLSVPNPPHHARNHYRQRLLITFSALAVRSSYLSSLRASQPIV